MGRFESPLQVVGLFLAASVVSVGVIFFINAEAHNRQTHNHSHPQHLPEPASLRADEMGWDLPKNEVGDAFTAGAKEQISSEVSLSSALLSSSSAELTSSNYTSGSESVGGLGTNNVTLLNFLEDGLEKLLVLIKQAKHTYKSYYLPEEKLNQQAGATSTSNTDCHPIKDNDTPPLGADGDDGGATARRRNRPLRRKKRNVLRMKRAAAIPPSGISKRGRIGENEPYYWQQMLEDNNRDNHHQHHNHQKKEKDKSEAVLHHQNQNQKHHQPHTSSYYHHPQPQQQHQPQIGGGVPENNHYIYPVGIPRAAPAVAFTSGSGGDNLQLQHGGGPGNHHSSTSDFHKIRHAMRKLGGLESSVVERMILDTKSSGRGHPSGGGGGQPNHNQNQHPHQQNQFGHAHFSPSGRSNTDQLLSSGHQHHNHAYAKSNSASNEASLLTTATTKTTHSGRQDQGLYVNQLGNQHQQLAQSLLPPTVTWLSGSGNSTIRFLPLPSSSLATGSKQGRRKSVMDRDEDESDPEDNEMRQVNNNADNDDDDDDESNENLEASSSKNTQRKNKKERQQQKRKMKKGKKKNSELSYSLSSREEQEVEETRTRSQEEVDYSLPFTPEEEESDDRSRDDDKQTNNNNKDNGYGDVGDPLIEEEDDDNEEDREREDLLYNSNIDSDDNEAAEEEASNKNVEKKRRTKGDHPFSSAGHDGKTCYRTDDVLIVVAITCCLNFAFVLLIWALVRWFSISSNPKEKDFHQNLGDCDDTLDPTVVFHGVTEDPCWALASKEVRGGASASGAGGMIGGGGGNTGMTLRSTASTAGVGTIGSRGRGYERGEVGGYMGTMGSVHSGNKVDLFPIMGKHGGGSALTNTIGAAVMTMTMERSRGGDGAGMYDHIGGGGSSSLMINGNSFRPEHVPVHHGSSGQMHRSYSQSMEDLRYLQ